MLERILIVGVGQAAAQAIDTLRRKGFAGSLTIIGEEPHLPYQRPPLSKQYLSGAIERDRLLLRPPQFYADHRVETRLGQRVEHIERDARKVRLDDGTELDYDALLLATGSRPRKLEVPGSNLPGVHYLRRIDDVDRMRSALERGRRIVIIGGGYIGLEVAATARALGLDVTVLEATDRLMNRVTCREVSEFYDAEHARHGVRIVYNAQVRALEAGSHGHVGSVVCEDGTEYPADLVLIGIGVLPRDELAQAAGLECANGVVVDQHCRTSDPHIFAAGDCTNHPSVHYGRHIRLESVDNAFEQGATAALNMLGIATPHDKVPWFWSDQYDLKMVIIGLSQGYDTKVMRGSPAARSFSVCYLYRGELIAVDTVNHAKDQMAARRLVAARARPDVVKLSDTSIALKDCL